MPIRIRHGSDNIFTDLGFDRAAAEQLRVRSELMIALSTEIAGRGLTRVEAAELLGVAKRRVSHLRRGKIDRFSIDTLIAMLGRAGIGVTISLSAVST